MRHDWRVTKWEPGSKEMVCHVCNAEKVCYTMGMKIIPKWRPAMLDGKRQPFCPGYPVIITL